MTNKQKLQRAFIALTNIIKSNTEEIHALNIKVVKLENKIKYLRKIVKAASLISPN